MEILLPVLASVPNISKPPLSIKATTSGITILKQNSFRNRYTGNKFSAVDINGNLWLQKTELMKEIAPVKILKKKKAQVETQAGIISLNGNNAQISENLSTLPTALPTKNKELSTYSINKREVRQRILGYINTMRGKKELYFWTVTFPPEVSDAMAYRAFNIWLTSLRQYKLLSDYIWIAERQPDTGTIHYHIAIPHKMPVQRANSMMKGTLKNFIKRGELNYSIFKIARYNGVDIAKNRTTRRVTNFAIKKGSRALITYLTKYITKNEGTFTHLAWHNSRGFSSLFTGITFNVPEFQKLGGRSLLDMTKRFKDDDGFFEFIPWKDDRPPEAITRHLYLINSYLQSQLN